MSMYAPNLPVFTLENNLLNVVTNSSYSNLASLGFAALWKLGLLPPSVMAANVN